MCQLAGMCELREWRNALALIQEASSPLPSVSLALNEAVGLIVAESVRSPWDIPLFASSAYDGYAVIAQDVESATRENPAVLQVVGEARAGKPFMGTLSRGQAVEIMTGAPVPTGASAIAKVEDTHRREGAVVEILRPFADGFGVRPAGLDIRKDEIVVRRGEKLTVGLLGVLAAIGMSEVKVIRRPEVTICVTGDELLEPGDHERPAAEQACVYDTNSVMLGVLTRQMGAHVRQVLRVPDDPVQLRTALEANLGNCDVFVFSGGVSMGRYDYVRPVFYDFGGVEIFWGVKQQPGKPLFFGKARDMFVLGLPGNPVSAFFCADLYLRTLVKRLAGDLDYAPTEFMVIAGEDFSKQNLQVAFRRAVLRLENNRLVAYSTGPSDSNLVHTIARIHGYLLIPSERAKIRAGDPAIFVAPELERLLPEPLKSLCSVMCNFRSKAAAPRTIE
ncbi:MAG: molybdopterin molybdotransferase MoeA [Candidatus Sumerlaeaceae bacterium]|nr:molybdopterin molybdotransferase MoeA [Candidatus Sumerlaeaceae bacterium]